MTDGELHYHVLFSICGINAAMINGHRIYAFNKCRPNTLRLTGAVLRSKPQPDSGVSSTEGGVDPTERRGLCDY